LHATCQPAGLPGHARQVAAPPRRAWCGADSWAEVRGSGQGPGLDRAAQQAAKRPEGQSKSRSTSLRLWLPLLGSNQDSPDPESGAARRTSCCTTTPTTALLRSS